MKRLAPLAAGGALAAILVSAVLGRAQEPPPKLPTFGAGVELVRLDVSVLSGNRFVTDLQQSDIEI
jgi:hypothetical protein